MVVVVTTSSRFDGLHSSAGVNHHQILVVSGADQIIKELLHAEPVFDQHVRATEVRQVGWCGLKVVGPQVGWDQGRDICAVTSHRFREQCDRQKRGDHFHSFAFGCIGVVDTRSTAGHQAKQKRHCAQTRKHRSHSVLKARAGLRFRARSSSLMKNDNHYRGG